MLVPILPSNGSRFDPLAAECGFTPLGYRQPIPESARCHYCGARATSRDHVTPWADQGSNEWWNLVPACDDCNNARGDDPSTCRCRFCKRARDLYALGHRRTGHGRARKKDNRPSNLTYQIGDILDTTDWG